MMVMVLRCMDVIQHSTSKANTKCKLLVQGYEGEESEDELDVCTHIFMTFTRWVHIKFLQ